MRTYAENQRGLVRRIITLVASGGALAIVAVLGVQIYQTLIRDDIAGRTGVSDQTVQDAKQFVGPNDLFVLPELGDTAQAHSPSSQVQATYEFSKLLGPRLDEVLSRDGLDALHQLATDPEVAPLPRLQAFVTLKTAGDKRWQEGLGLAEVSASQLPKEVSLENLPEYLALMDPIWLLTTDVQRAELIEFEPGSDPIAQRLAATSMALSHLFRNDAEVPLMFAVLQQEMHVWLQAPNSTPDQMLISTAALIGPTLHPLSADEYQAVSDRINEFRGCGDAPTFIAADYEKTTCSIALTSIAQLALEDDGN